jgi:Asp-tRNA(Asn)/Glu-tRNA(Gln) amidotransferase B subunit
MQTACSGRALRTLGIGCGIIVILIIAGVIVLSFTWRSVVADMMTQGIRAAVEQSGLNQHEQKGVIDALDRVVKRFEEGKLSAEQLNELARSFFEGELAMVILFRTFSVRYIEPSGLSPEEKEGGKRVLRQFFRGIHEGKVSEDQVKQFFQRFPKQDGRIKEKLTDAELKGVLSEMQTILAGKEISAEEFKVDVVEEVNRIVDSILKE